MSENVQALKHGLRRDIEGNVIDLDGTVLERCEECGEFCLPDEVSDNGFLCSDCDLSTYDIDVHPKPVSEFTVTATIVSVEQGKPRVFIMDLYLED